MPQRGPFFLCEDQWNYIELALQETRRERGAGGGYGQIFWISEALIWAFSFTFFNNSLLITKKPITRML